MARTGIGTVYVRMLLCAVGIMAVLSLGLSARSSWSYTQTDDSQTLILVGAFEGYFSGMPNGLEVVITNPTNSLITILWDESAMVLPGGVSERVIHTGVRIIDKAAPQAPTALAPRSRTTEAIWPASYVTTRQYSPLNYIQLSNNCTISLYLTIQDASGKRTENWTWSFAETRTPEVAKAPRKPINWWLWGGIFLGLFLIGLMVPDE